MSGGSVAQFVAHVDRLLSAGHELFPATGGGPGVASGGGSVAPAVPAGAGGLGVGVADAGGRYSQSHGSAVALDDQTGAAAGAAGEAGRQGRANSGAVRDTARVQATAIGPATAHPAGVRLMVSAMDDRLAQMQREIDATRAQNKLLATRLRQLAVGYRMGAVGPAMGMAGLPLAGGSGAGGGGFGGLNGLGGLGSVPKLARGFGAVAPVGGATAGALGPGRGGGVGERAVAYAESKLGRPYVWGARGPNAYDCSGLTSDAYAHAGIVLPRTSYEQIRCGIPVSRDEIRPGDLVFSNFSAPGRPEHVQLAISGSTVIEAPTPGDHVRFSPIPTGPVVIRRVV